MGPHDLTHNMRVESEWDAKPAVAAATNSLVNLDIDPSFVRLSAEGPDDIKLERKLDFPFLAENFDTSIWALLEDVKEAWYGHPGYRLH